MEKAFRVVLFRRPPFFFSMIVVAVIDYLDASNGILNLGFLQKQTSYRDIKLG